MNIEGTEVVYRADYDDLLTRLAKAEAQLKEAVELLTSAAPKNLSPNIRPDDWWHRRDAFLAEQKDL